MSYPMRDQKGEWVCTCIPIMTIERNETCPNHGTLEGIEAHLERYELLTDDPIMRAALLEQARLRESASTSTKRRRPGV